MGESSLTGDVALLRRLHRSCDDCFAESRVSCETHRRDRSARSLFSAEGSFSVFREFSTALLDERDRLPRDFARDRFRIKRQRGKFDQRSFLPLFARAGNNSFVAIWNNCIATHFATLYLDDVCSVRAILRTVALHSFRERFTCFAIYRGQPRTDVNPVTSAAAELSRRTARQADAKRFMPELINCFAISPSLFLYLSIYPSMSLSNARVTTRVTAIGNFIIYPRSNFEIDTIDGSIGESSSSENLKTKSPRKKSNHLILPEICSGSLRVFTVHRDFIRARPSIRRVRIRERRAARSCDESRFPSLAKKSIFLT